MRESVAFHRLEGGGKKRREQNDKRAYRFARLLIVATHGERFFVARVK